MKLTIPDGRTLDIRRVTVKLGTKQITDITAVNMENIRGIVDSIASLRQSGIEFIITASGAIGLAMHHLYGNKSAAEKLTLSEKQALSGFGQVHLMELFKKEFARHKINVGQVLLTHFILDNRGTYLNARNTLNTMLQMGILPIINENDSVAVDEIKFGDNDRLGAYVSVLTDSQLYIMLTDIDGLYENYGKPGQKLIPVVSNLNSVLSHAGKQEESFTKGGMVTKLEAARITTVSGVPCVIANGFKKGILDSIFGNLSEGTLFLPSSRALTRKKRWITNKKPRGALVLDPGAVKAVQSHKSLLPSGVKSVTGDFKSGDVIRLLALDKTEVALGLTHFSSGEIKIIAGHKTTEIPALLGEQNPHLSVVHIDNMVVYDTAE